MDSILFWRPALPGFHRFIACLLKNHSKMYKNFFLLFLLVLTLPACKRNEVSNGHSHDEVFLYLTAYSDDFEVFAEAAPFVVGQQSGIYAHFTWLKDFKPLEDAVITLNLVVGQEGIRQTVRTPVREGIYSFQLQPVAAGKARVYFEIKTLNGDYQVSVPDVVVYEDAHQAIHTAEELMVHDPNAILFNKEQSWKVNFATEFPSKEAFGQVIKTTARVFPAQGDELIIPARTSGLVQFGAGVLTEGMPVSAGKSLMSISSGNLADQNMSLRLAEARNTYEQARLDLERAEKLAANQIVSERELLQARTSFENAKLVYDNLSRHFSQAGQSVSSPSSGVIRQVWVQQGQYVETGQPLVSILQNKRLMLHADVPQSYATDLQSLVSANIRLPGQDKVFSLEQLGGKILSFGQATNDDNYLIPVHLEVNQTGDLLPGGFVELFLMARGEHEAITVSRDAILEEQGTYYVFVQQTPEQFVKREIRPGASDGVRMEILEGLQTTDRVVSRGAVWVKLARSSSALDPHAGHVH